MVDNDVTPEVSTDSESQLDIKVNSTLKNLHQIKLDSDEDEMRMDYIRENTVDENNNDVDESSDDDINLMNNIHFAELEIDEVNLSDDNLKKKKSTKDFLPRLYSVDNVEVSKSDDSSSFNSDDYKGLSKLDSDISSEKPVFKSKSKSKSDSITEESVEDLVDEEISEVHSTNSDYSKSITGKTSEHSKSKSDSRSVSSKSSDNSSRKTNYSKKSASKKSRHSKSKSRSKNKKFSYSDDSSTRSSDRTLSSSDVKDIPSDNYSSDTSSSLSNSQSKKSSHRSKTRRSSRATSDSSHSSRSVDEKSTPREKKKTKSTKATHVQTQTRAFINDDKTEDVLKFRYDWQRNEPSNIAAHCLDPVTIDVLTNYNPAVLASNDLMKYHLQLMQQHIEDSRRLYEAYANENMNNNYKYTTVEDTKKYIEKNAPKVISFEEALRLAKKEDEFR